MCEMCVAFLAAQRPTVPPEGAETAAQAVERICSGVPTTTTQGEEES